MDFIYQVRDDATPQELWVALRATVFARCNGYCEHCGSLERLEVAHKFHHAPIGRHNPDFDPDHCLGLCPSCHRKMDHHLGHRPSGRPKGLPHTAETRRLIGEANRRAASSPEWRAAARARAIAQWDRQGRKHPSKPCEHCGTVMMDRHRYGKFCSPRCHYAWRLGKPRSARA